jgi:hypothetical protein
MFCEGHSLYPAVQLQGLLLRLLQPTEYPELRKRYRPCGYSSSGTNRLKPDSRIVEQGRKSLFGHHGELIHAVAFDFRDSARAYVRRISQSTDSLSFK